MAGQIATADRPQASARPQPQTTGETQGGPFIRHAPKGRRPVYNNSASFGVYFGPAVVAAPGWYTGFRWREVSATNSGTGGVISSGAGGVDAPFSSAGLVQIKDAWGTNLFSGPGYDMKFLVQLLSGAYGWGLTRDLRNLPTWTGMTAASGAWAYDTYFPFEFAQAYGVIAAANAALLPQVQISTAALSTLFSTSPSVAPSLSYELDADFYWLPDAPTQPPGIGTTCQWIYQPCNPPVPSAASQRVQLPRLGGYLSILGLDLRDSTGLRVDGYPGFSGGGRPGIFIDGVEQINSDLNFILDDLAIQMGWGAVVSGATQTAAGTTGFVRPTGVLAISRKTSLAQMDLGLLDTGEKYLSPLALDTPIPTTCGPVAMGDIEPGMLVYGSDGEPTPVIGISEIFTGRECYRITFEHGESFTADAEHQWPVFGRLTRTDELLAGDVIGDHKVASVEPVASVPTRCLATGRDDHLFQVGRAGVLTKNTNPGTQVEINGTPWSTISNTPAVLNAVIGQIVPSGPLVQGLPEV